MSEMAKAARAAMKAKAKKMSSGEPHEKVDASSWSPPEMMNTGAKTGMRPLTKRAYKKGGKVVGYCEGGEAVKHAGRKPRKSGGRTIVSDLINRNAKKANLYRDGGDAHVGGLKRGGRAHKLYGGDVAAKRTATPLPYGGMKKGGKVHMDAPADKKLIKKALRQHDEHMHGGKHEDIKLKKGGRTHKQYGGSDGKYGSIDELMRAKGIGPYAPRRETAPRDDDMTNPFTGEPRTGGSAKYSNYDTDAESQAALKNAWLKQSKPEYATSQPVPKSEKRGGRAERAKGGEIKGKTSSGDSYNYEGLTDKQRGLAQRLGGANPERKSAVRTKEDVERTARASGGRAKKGGKAEYNYLGGTRPTGGRMPKADGGRLEAMREKIRNTPIDVHSFDGDQSVKRYSGKLRDTSDNDTDMLKVAGALKRKGKYAGRDNQGDFEYRSKRASGGRAKGKTNIIIAINPQHGGHGMMQPNGMPPQGPTPRPGGAAPVAPPTAPMPMLPGMGNLPPGAMPPGAMPPGAGMMPPGMMPRKAGGRVYRSYKDMDAGAGSGLGRLEKAEIQRRK